MRVKGLLAAALGVGLLAPAVTSCTGGDSSESTGPTTSTGADITLTQPSAPLTVKVAQLGGGLKKKQFAPAKEAISKSISAWVGGAFLDPKYPATDPGSDFDAAFA